MNILYANKSKVAAHAYLGMGELKERGTQCKCKHMDRMDTWAAPMRGGCLSLSRTRRAAVEE